MEQLLSIHNIPLKMDVKVEPGKFEVNKASNTNSTLTQGNTANKSLDTSNHDSITLNNITSDIMSNEANSVEQTNESSTVDHTPQFVNTSEMKFVPRKVECKIQEFPHIEIEYLGKPIYVPPSSAPDRKREQTGTPKKDSEDQKTELDLLV